LYLFQLLQDRAIETRRAFGFFFMCISIAVAAASVLSEIASLKSLPIYYYAIIWISSFGAVFGAGGTQFRKAAPAIRRRMKTSIKWPAGAKALNAVCWAGPFVAIVAFPSLYQYLIILGIGLGNMSTYVLIKKYNKTNSREQLIVGLISFVSIPIAIAIDGLLFATHQDIAVMLSRILIAIAYASGGVYALTKAGPVGFDPTTSGSLQ
jgi:hypothetical protein